MMDARFPTSQVPDRKVAAMIHALDAVQTWVAG
jgi:hypothetical protein